MKSCVNATMTLQLENVEKVTQLNLKITPEAICVHKTLLFKKRKAGFNLTSIYSLPVIEQGGHKVVLQRYYSQPPLKMKNSESCYSGPL